MERLANPGRMSARESRTGTLSRLHSNLNLELHGLSCDVGVLWPRFFLSLAFFVRPSTPPRSQSVLRHFLEAQRVGCSTDGIQTCPQTSQTATRIIFHPMDAIIHKMLEAQKTVEFSLLFVCIMPNGHCAYRA
jgi:hypothetical protein